MCLGTSEIGQSVNNISIPVAKCQNSRRSKLPPSAVAEILAAAAQASQEAPNRAVKRRVRQRLHKKLGSLLTCEEFGRAMERFRIMEEESGAGAEPEAASQGPTSSSSTNVLPTRCSPQLIALPIFVPMMTPPQALQAPAARQPAPAGAMCRIPISLAGASLVKPQASSTVKTEAEDMPDMPEALEPEKPSPSSKAQSESETTTDDEAELESFSDLRIEWVRATSEGPLPVERTFIQFNTRTHVSRHNDAGCYLCPPKNRNRTKSFLQLKQLSHAPAVWCVLVTCNAVEASLFEIDPELSNRLGDEKNRQEKMEFRWF